MLTVFRNVLHHPSTGLLSGLGSVLQGLLWIGLAALLAACSGREDEDDAGTQAEQARIGELHHAQGMTVFVSNISFSLHNYGDLTGVS